MDILAIQNELARIRMDVLSTESHNQALRSDLKELEYELKEKEKMIEKFGVYLFLVLLTFSSITCICPISFEYFSSSVYLHGFSFRLFLSMFGTIV